MKKVVFIQTEAHVLGGVFKVNKTLGLELYKRGYDVKIVSLRNNHPNEHEDTPFEQIIVNSNDKWNFVHRRDVLNSIKLGIKTCLITLHNYFIQRNQLRKDYKKLSQFILKERPDYIIASHYQVLDGIPNKYLKRTIHVQHSTVNALLEDKQNYKTLKKYNNRIFAMMWLSNAAKTKAEMLGFIKNYYIYNPIRFDCLELADVVKNKKIINLSRFSPEKRIDLMVDMVNDVFKNNEFKNWTFELYGEGNLSKKTLKIIKKSKQIFYKGIVSDPKDVLLSSSLILNTSIFEGFPLSLIEAFNCGVPALTFNYGESVFEQVKDNYNGYVISQNDIIGYKSKLIFILKNPEKLKELSKNSKNFSNQFLVSKIVDQWEKIFKQIK